ncbi:hypothetical protein FHG87_012722 [Trinorchestia longiramus]|nr:hypothetical protein FHG87_012722 [Trinorchestia longiramus]
MSMMPGEGIVLLLSLTVLIAIICILASLSLKSEGRIVVACSGALSILVLFLMLNSLAQRTPSSKQDLAWQQDVPEEEFHVGVDNRFWLRLSVVLTGAVGALVAVAVLLLHCTLSRFAGPLPSRPHKLMQPLS